MKTKLILAVVLAVALGGTAGWFAPHPAPTANTAAVPGRQILSYVCPMHPTIKYEKPGDCPICGMKLQPVYADETQTNAPATMQMGCCSRGGNP